MTDDLVMPGKMVSGSRLGDIMVLLGRMRKKLDAPASSTALPLAQSKMLFVCGFVCACV